MLLQKSFSPALQFADTGVADVPQSHYQHVSLPVPPQNAHTLVYKHIKELNFAPEADVAAPPRHSIGHVRLHLQRRPDHEGRPISKQLA